MEKLKLEPFNDRINLLDKKLGKLSSKIDQMEKEHQELFEVREFIRYLRDGLCDPFGE